VFEEYPSLDNGLSQTEENVPWNTGEGSSILGIAAKTLGNSDGTIGDIPLYDRIRNFLSDAEPLLEPAVPGVSVADVDLIRGRLSSSSRSAPLPSANNC
jgi:hypothetical protein